MLGLSVLSSAPISALLATGVAPNTVFNGYGMPRMIFDTRAPTTTRRECFDFTSMLAFGETINTASVSVAVVSGTDSNPTGLLSGGTTIAGPKVYQKFTGGLTGVIYGATCTALTSQGQTLQLAGFIAVLGST